MTAGRRAGALLAAAALTTSLTALLPAGAQAAQRADNAPPTAVEDRVEMFAGGTVEVDLLGNDTDPDGDDLAVCRPGPLPRGVSLFDPDWFDLPPGSVEPSDGTFEVSVKRGVRPRTLRLTYYLCDVEHLVPGQLEIDVRERPEISVRRVPDKPGVLKVRNPSDVRMQFVVIEGEGEKLLKLKPLRARTTISVRVHYRSIRWAAGSARIGLVDRGRIADTGWRGDPSPSQSSSLAGVPRWAVTRG